MLQEQHLARKNSAEALSSGPVLLASAIYLSAVLVNATIILIRTHGHQVYLLDDSYIHAAIARNLVQHHVYGVSPYATVFASSSVIWPFLIAAVYFVIGVHVWVLFALNVLASLLSLFAADKLFRSLASPLRSLSSNNWRLGLLFTFIFGIPLLGMTFVGMEHVLHLALCLLLLEAFVQLSRNPSSDVHQASRLCFYAALATSVRYETLFLLFPLCTALLLHKKIWTAAFTGIAAFTPVVLFGLFALSRGSTFFPGPLSVKTAANTGFFTTAISNFLAISSLGGAVTSSFLLGCAILTLTLYSYRKKLKTDLISAEILAIALSALLIHAGLARFGWFFRYEVYLLGPVVISVFAISSQLLGRPSSLKRVTLSMLVLFLAAFVVRGAGILYLAPRNALAIYSQQYQTGLFIARYYPGQSVAINDIGAPTYLSDFRCLDLWGLASPEIGKLVISGSYNRKGLLKLATSEHVRIAILYPSLLGKIVPAQWVPVARFTIADIPGHLFLGAKDVEFYAADPQLADTLAQQVRSFAANLPHGVLVQIEPPFVKP